SWTRSMAKRSSGPRQHDLALLAVGPVQHRHVADALHQRGAGTRGQGVDQRVALLAVGGGHHHLDPLVVFQRAGNLGDHRVGQALAPQLQHRLESVGLAAQEADLGGSKVDGHGGGGHVRKGTQGIMAARMRPHEAMATRSRSSQRWLQEHFADPFVQKAQPEGMRSRAAYKLEELVDRARLLRPGMTVVDLGAAPGRWSQWVRQALGDSGRVIALDILDMPPLAGVEFIHGDFREDVVLSQLESQLDGASVDLVLSDMAPNKSGVNAVDQP